MVRGQELAVDLQMMCVVYTVPVPFVITSSVPVTVNQRLLCIFSCSFTPASVLILGKRDVRFLVTWFSIFDERTSDFGTN